MSSEVNPPSPPRGEAGSGKEGFLEEVKPSKEAISVGGNDHDNLNG